ncbi:MAG: luciferase [Candidatus Tectimicrobiota bacterium]|nr:MAG: luciferase [Candidatus Tectomicrobia bacterium]
MALKFGFIPIEGGRFYREALEEVVRGEELGFDSVWMEEHHAVKDHYWPSPLMALAGFATCTSRLLLGTDILVFPFYHPVRLAEEVALLDVMSGGRVVLGTAIGYKPDEFALYHTPLAGRGARFEEGLRLVKALWTQETVTFRGRYYQAEEVRIEPKPLTQPHPPLWIGGWGPLTLKRAATLADAWLPGPTADLPRLLAGKQQVLAHCAAAGRPAPTEWPLTREVLVADTEAQARALAERHLMVSYRQEYAGGWRHPFIDPEVARDLDSLRRDRFILGTPAQCIAQIRRFVEAYGVTHLICRLYFPGLPHAHILRELELLAREVMPAFR